MSALCLAYQTDAQRELPHSKTDVYCVITYTPHPVYHKQLYTERVTSCVYCVTPHILLYHKQLYTERVTSCVYCVNPTFCCTTNSCTQKGSLHVCTVLIPHSVVPQTAVHRKGHFMCVLCDTPHSVVPQTAVHRKGHFMCVLC